MNGHGHVGFKQSLLHLNIEEKHHLFLFYFTSLIFLCQGSLNILGGGEGGLTLATVMMVARDVHSTPQPIERNNFSCSCSCYSPLVVHLDFGAGAAVSVRPRMLE